jgi:hypothetical protein
MDLQEVALKFGRYLAGMTPYSSLPCEGEDWGIKVKIKSLSVL